MSCLFGRSTASRSFAVATNQHLRLFGQQQQQLHLQWQQWYPRIVASAAQPTSIRFYRGEAMEGVAKNLSAEEEALLKIAKPKADKIYAKHVSLPILRDIPAASFAPTENHDIETNPQELELEIRRKRLIYRSKQRGWLEVDLLLGTWATQHVYQLSLPELDEYEEFLNLETIDIYNVITLRLDVPEQFQTTHGNGVVERIQAWARDSPLGKADPEKYKQVKTENKLI